MELKDLKVGEYYINSTHIDKILKIDYDLVDTKYIGVKDIINNKFDWYVGRLSIRALKLNESRKLTKVEKVLYGIDE